MRKIVMFNSISVDGYFADKDGGLEWHHIDEAFNKLAIDYLQHAGTILLGRITFDLFESYWPKAEADPTSTPNEIIIAKLINSTEKVVFSDTINSPNWLHSIVYDGDIEKRVKALKAKDGKNIIIYGSGTIVQQLTNLGLIDEYHLMVNPIILGDGKPLFKDVAKITLKHIGMREFKNGNVLLSYAKR